MIENPVWNGLLGAHAPLAQRHGRAAAYDPAVSQFGALESGDPAAWDDLRALLGPRRVAVLLDADVPAGFRILHEVVVHRMVARSWVPQPDADVIDLGPDDVPEMLDLTRRTKPGPFEPRTIEMGRYAGIRVDGRLVAMAGERMHPPGFTEVSAVCTDPEFTGRGFARRAMGVIGAGILGRGETPFLHVAVGNPARALYERLGFVVVRDLPVRAVLPV